MVIDVFGTHVSQTKDDDAWQVRSAGGKEVAEVEIMGQEDSSFVAGFPQDLRVVQLIKALLVKVRRLMPQTLKEVNHGRRNAHVREELHVDVDSSG